MIVSKLIRSFLAPVVARFVFPDVPCQQGEQRTICVLVSVGATCTGQSRHRKPSLKVRVHILRPAGPTATRPVMRNLCRACGLPGPERIDARSRYFVLQGLFLPVIAHVLISVEYCILCIHDFPSLNFSCLGCDERLVPWRAGRSPPGRPHSSCSSCSRCDSAYTVKDSLILSTSKSLLTLEHFHQIEEMNLAGPHWWIRRTEAFGSVKAARSLEHGRIK